MVVRAEGVDGMIPLTSLQSEAAWARLRRDGFLSGDASFSAFRDTDAFLRAYAWMKGEMKKRLPEAHSAGDVLWAWARWEGRDAPVDLRSLAPKEPRPFVRLDLLVPRDQVLLSDFDMWHFVLSNHAPDRWEKVFQVGPHRPACVQASLWTMRLEWVTRSSIHG